MDTKLSDDDRRRLLASVLDTDEVMPPSALVRAQFAARSHMGRALNGNDDHYLVLRLGRYEKTLLTSLIDRDVPPSFDEWGYAAVIADGMGRDGVGAVAARIAISTLAHLEVQYGQWSMRIDPATAAELLDRAEWFYHRTHEAVLRWHRSHLDAGRMAAAMTTVYSAGDDLFVAHVGHTRCYLFRNGLLTQLTRDQTLRERLAAAPQPTPVPRALEDMDHLLTDSLGAEGDDPGVMVEHFRLADDDSVLLCTNGLTDTVTDAEISDVLASRRPPAAQCDSLVDSALAKGTRDNVTVILANYRIPMPSGGRP